MANDDIKLDPLYSIFEKHLYDIENKAQSEQDLIEKIAQDYLHYLESNSIVIPAKWKTQIMNEIHDHIHQMIVKKMYGCLSTQRRKY